MLVLPVNTCLAGLSVSLPASPTLEDCSLLSTFTPSVLSFLSTFHLLKTTLLYQKRKTKAAKRWNLSVSECALAPDSHPSASHKGVKRATHETGEKNLRSSHSPPSPLLRRAVSVRANLVLNMGERGSVCIKNNESSAWLSACVSVCVCVSVSLSLPLFPNNRQSRKPAFHPA